MSKQPLEDILKSGDLGKCRDFFLGMPEQERRRLAPKCIDWLRKSFDSRTFDAETRTYNYRDHMPTETIAVAVFSTGTAAELKKLGWQARISEDLMYEIFVDRRPDWIVQWVQQQLDAERYWGHWRLIRRLVLSGLLEKPEHPNYYLGMIGALKGPRLARDSEPSLEAKLRSDPTLLEDDVWRLFEYEGGGDNSLANCDKVSLGGKWSDSLIALAATGDLSRDRLLTCSLDALERDFNHYRAKWFLDFHDALQPTKEEQAAFAPQYLHLLGASAPNVVTWAYKKVEQLAKAKAIDPKLLIANIRPVLQSRQKGIVNKALKLLDTVAKKSKVEKSDLAFVVLPALGHEIAEVQANTLGLIETYGDSNNSKFVREFQEYASVIAPSERKRFDAWLATTGESVEVALPAEESAAPVDLQQIKAIDPKLRKLFAIDDLLESRKQGTTTIPAVRFDGTDIPRLPGQAKIAPIEDLDELIESCSRLIEDAKDIDHVERAYDGISRLCDVRPDDFDSRVAPLLQRVVKLLKKDRFPFAGIGPGDDLCGLIYAWCTGIVLEGKRKTSNRHAVVQYTLEGEEHSALSGNLDKPIGFLSRRILAIAKRVAERKPAALWSAPTHQGAWIDPHVLVERVRASGKSEPDLYDVILALLRLAPDDRKGALAQLKSNSSELTQAVRYALGAPKVAIGETAPLWFAAARCRAPWNNDVQVAAAFPDQGPDTAQAAKHELIIEKTRSKRLRIGLQSLPPAPKKLDPYCVTACYRAINGTLDHCRFELGGAGGRSSDAVAWTASIWPQARESYFAVAAFDLAENLDWWGAEWQNKTFLEPLFEPTTPLREMGLLLLAIGLGAKDPGEHGLATDVTIATIEDGRLGSDNLGQILHQLLPTGLVKPVRWAKTLAEAARISTVHAAVIQQSLQQALSIDEKSLPRDWAKLLELLLQLSIDLEQSISHPGCLELLRSLKGSGKGPKIAKLLLQRTASPESSQRIIDLALQHRIHTLEARMAKAV
ncbi:DUF6493 family protein [Blastopirellula sp. J2-11]|uniref:DUF6493 family protein n=1 Tax=Blastopirellula sp. J2-11 TaxID=2943192 RepID=UPI0021C5963A|nr:DUF6493 family protein [Blastopirellula sp. J2-11]UUO07201.1 DUF6493 family protein [Blastopirellula sp. J2-11]